MTRAGVFGRGLALGFFVATLRPFDASGPAPARVRSAPVDADARACAHGVLLAAVLGVAAAVLVVAGWNDEPVPPRAGSGLVSERSPDGRTIAYSDSRGVVFLDLRTGARRRGPDRVARVSFAPDGRSVVYARVKAAQSIPK